MCNEAVENNYWMFEYVPDQFVAEEMCNEAVQSEPWMLEYVPDQYRT